MEALSKTGKAKRTNSPERQYTGVYGGKKLSDQKFFRTAGPNTQF